MKYIEILWEQNVGTAQWVWSLITLKVPWNKNYFYAILIFSLIAWGLEILFPWRKKQSIIRKDFWLDAFYMYFNIFVFSIVIYGFFEIFRVFMQDEVGISMSSLALIDMSNLPNWVQLLIFFILNDIIQWGTHLLLHKVPFLWRFHKVHHSVVEMGFAAHFRYHWMENIFYKPGRTLIVMILGGFEPQHAFIVHFIAIAIGHLNHSNIKLTWGPLKYILNNPVMHLYHHAKTLPEGSYGVNFGISLSIWDYIFQTNYIPEDSGLIELGFDDLEKFPKGFVGQITSGFKEKKHFNK